MSKPKIDKKKYAFGTKKYLGEIYYGEGQIFKFETEKECDEAMQTKNFVQFHADFTECICCGKTTEPQKRFIAKAKDEDYCNLSTYVFFCSQKCFDEYFDVPDKPKDDIDEYIKDLKECITEILKPQ